MKKTSILYRFVAAVVLVFFTGCASSVPQSVRLVSNEPEARIIVNGDIQGSGKVQLQKIKPSSGPLDIHVQHEDYSDFSLQVEPTEWINMSFKEKAPWFIGGLVATVLGLFGFINYAMSDEEDSSLAPVIASGTMLAMGPYTMVNVSLNTFKKKAYLKNYTIDLSANRYYSEMGFSKIDGYNKAGYNAESLDADGNYYKGPLADWQKEGFGLYVCADGTRYMGMFHQDQPSGLGRFEDETGGIFVGSWRDGIKDGPGVYIDRDGIQHREIWTAGEKTSSSPAGRIRSEDSIWVFFGEGIRNGWAEGFGNAIALDLSARVENGTYRDGRLVSGRMIMPDGTIYDGRFANELLVKGEIFSTDGTHYTGELADGIPEGKGYLRSPDGTVYEGNFVQARFEGQGSLTLSNGDVYEGPFNNGVPHGQGVYTNISDNLVERCEFYEGRRIDQAYQMRIAQAKAAEEARLREEAEKKAAEEAARKEQERQKRLEEKRKEEATNKAVTSGLFGLGAGMLGSRYGMDAVEATKFGTAVAQDVYQGTDGEHMKAAGDEIIANRKTMAEYEQKYGASDLSDTASYSDSLSPSYQTKPEQRAGGSVSPSSTVSSAAAASNLRGSQSSSVHSSPEQAQNSQSKGVLVRKTFTVEINPYLKSWGMGAAIGGTKDAAILQAKYNALAELPAFSGELLKGGKKTELDDVDFSNIKTRYVEASEYGHSKPVWAAGLTAIWTGDVVEYPDKPSGTQVRSN
ncbi:hypothetical protein [Marispirochaeta aestuarii]|uniref:MORN repeat-containing protein n=1 Tax=Marispirochaeta aestuarii TaxID=1963862 RepID=UPI0029C7F490|nr:hypothetical protein [Marispirochaeta aestuarii]